jgi:hypothetical protein
VIGRSEYEVRGGEDGVYLLIGPSGSTVGAFYREDQPGWWRGAAFGHVRKLFLPAAEPLDVGRRFLQSH